MKKHVLTSLCVASAIAFTSSMVFANKKMPEGTVEITKALETLKSNGFDIVKKIEYDNGKYIAKVVNSDGKVMKVKIDAKSGDLLTKPSKDTKERMTALEVAKKVENAGYTNIFKIDTEWFHDRYQVGAFDKEGKKTELDVDAASGNIKKD